MSYQAYLEYKESGSKWLGEIPALWSAAPAKSLFALRSEKSNREDEHLTPSQKYGVLPQSHYMKITGNKVVLNLVGSDSMKHVEPDDFVIHLRSFQGGIEHSPVRGKVSNAYTVLIPNGSVYPQFFRWALKSDGYIQELRTTTDQLRDGQSIKFPNFGMVRIPSVPLAEQKQIADFLDRETEQIDNLIAEQQGLVENLTERRKAGISHAVTKGLNPNVDLKDSGSEWASRIPKHWSVKKFSRVIDINGGQVDPTAEPFADMLMIAPNHIEKFTGRLLLRESAAEQGAESGKYIATAGQVIYSKIRPNLCKATIAPTDCLCSADMYSMSGRSGAISNQFLLYFMLSKSFTDFATDSSMRVAMPKINRESLAPFRIWLPPVKEQHEIVAYLDEQARLVDALITEAKSLIDLLKERRSALISAAVTGKIDVRSEVLSRG